MPHGDYGLADTTDTNMKINTLIHEIAHELNHYTEKGKKFSKQEKEIHAEGTAYVITKTIGIQNKSPIYLATYVNDKIQIIESLKIISKISKKTFLNGLGQ